MAAARGNNLCGSRQIKALQSEVKYVWAKNSSLTDCRPYSHCSGGRKQSATACPQQTKWKSVSFQSPRRDGPEKKKEQIICKPNCSQCMSFTLTFIGGDGGETGAEEEGGKKEGSPKI